MEGYVQLLIGILFLSAGIPVGNFLAKKTKEELAENQRHFKTLITISVLGSVAGIVLRDDAVLFSFLFIAIVTSRSLRTTEFGVRRTKSLTGDVIKRLKDLSQSSRAGV